MRLLLPLMARLRRCRKSRPCSPAPISPYGVTKYRWRALRADVWPLLRPRKCFSALLQHFWPAAGSRFAVFRRPGKILHCLFWKRLSPSIFGDGEQSRDFTYVENAVQANLLACEAPNVSGKVFNVGTGWTRFTLNEDFASSWRKFPARSWRQSTSRRAMATFAIRKRISPRHANFWAMIRRSVSKKDWPAHSSGTATHANQGRSENQQRVKRLLENVARRLGLLGQARSAPCNYWLSMLCFSGFTVLP